MLMYEKFAADKAARWQRLMSLPPQDADKSCYASHILHVTHAALTLGHLAPLLWLLESFVTDWTRADLSLFT